MPEGLRSPCAASPIAGGAPLDGSTEHLLSNSNRRSHVFNGRWPRCGRVCALPPIRFAPVPTARLFVPLVEPRPRTARVMTLPSPTYTRCGVPRSPPCRSRPRRTATAVSVACASGLTHYPGSDSPPQGVQPGFSRNRREFAPATVDDGARGRVWRRRGVRVSGGASARAAVNMIGEVRAISLSALGPVRTGFGPHEVLAPSRCQVAADRSWRGLCAGFGAPSQCSYDLPRFRPTGESIATIRAARDDSSLARRRTVCRLLGYWRLRHVDVDMAQVHGHDR